MNPVTLTITEVTPGQQVYTPWGMVNSPAVTTTKQIILTPDQIAVLKQALA